MAELRWSFLSRRNSVVIFACSSPNGANILWERNEMYYHHNYMPWLHTSCTSPWEQLQHCSLASCNSFSSTFFLPSLTTSQMLIFLYFLSSEPNHISDAHFPLLSSEPNCISDAHFPLLSSEPNCTSDAHFPLLSSEPNRTSDAH